MDVGMIGQGLPPGVQNSHGACLRTKILRVGGTNSNRFVGSFEHQTVSNMLVVIKGFMKALRNGEHNMKIPDRNQDGFELIHPLNLFDVLAFGTMAVRHELYDCRICPH